MTLACTNRAFETKTTAHHHQSIVSRIIFEPSASVRKIDFELSVSMREPAFELRTSVRRTAAARSAATNATHDDSKNTRST